jgi:outer membrane lipoprotein-sorting protein
LTSVGRIELMKGNYLSMMRRMERKSKTSKQIMKKPSPKRCSWMNPNKKSILSQGKSSKVQNKEALIDPKIKLGVNSDYEIYQCSGLPLIDLQIDHDCDSDWSQIESGVTNLSW